MRTNSNSLAATHPDLARQWHPSKNGDLKPTDVTAGSNKKVWWKCPEGHEWQASIANRASKGNGCPYCTGKKVDKSNCLQTLYPDLVREWHPKNQLKPSDVSACSHRKVRWKCLANHEWETSIANRSRGTGCPYCVGQKVDPSTNCLQITNPELASEWHPTKNGELKPTEVTVGSGKKAWWTCKHNHEWQATINHRSHGYRCPYCANKLVDKSNCLQTINPELAREWHSKNQLKPTDVTVGSNKKVWWRCDNKHEWMAMINDRSRGRGCPYCFSKKRSG